MRDHADGAVRGNDWEVFHRANIEQAQGLTNANGEPFATAVNLLPCRALTLDHTCTMVSVMTKRAIRRVTVNLPDSLLRAAEEATGKGITETVIEGLEVLAHRRAYLKALALKGKLDLRIDVDRSRERARR